MAEKEESVEEKVEKVEQAETKKNEKTQLQLKQIELDELNDRYKRVFAEFENFKKRTQKEKENLYNSVLGDIIINMLPLIDNLDMATNAECKDESYKQGVELVQKQFKEFLAKNNVQEIPALGEIFDPSQHEAVSSVQDDTKQSQEIVQEYRKGYKIGSKVLRHSMVVVNQ
jgi:molecular chaperone GrpE